MGSKGKVRTVRNLDAGPLKHHVTSFILHMKSLGRSDKTVKMYSEATLWFAAEHLLTGGHLNEVDTQRRAADADDPHTFDPLDDWEHVKRPHLQSWMARLFARGHADSYINNQFRCLQAFFKWLAEDEEWPNPMLGMKGPSIAEKPVPVFEDDDITKLFAVVQGRDIWDRRDLAIMLMLRDTGMRLMEITGLKIEDINVVEREAYVTGKAKKARTVKYSFEAARALDKYMRMRGRHRLAHLPDLWVSPKGVLSHWGVSQMITRRAEQAGVEGVHPHRFRHHFSHTWLDRGGAEGDLMELNGWDSPQMLRRYGRSAASKRARRGYDRIMGEE